ncbi:DNA ligase D [Fervidibacillus albus]|uniref:DNA ligase (ATP) n=1 Tax=Fervidibacillus albus TaxID=2980026 RepID=A0A9E8LWL4_9BACI|nr:DNA ligase D [Fervidibacillus albus]WAA11048.1 DNA ligase D [Fervidibacillus albus]
MRPMLPTLTFSPPMGDEWVYETKYDGFRAFLYLDEKIALMSRNGNSLLSSFPEVNRFVHTYRSAFASLLPVILDGEITILVNEFKSDFSKVQKRARLKIREKIKEAVEQFPATFLAFDVLSWQGKNMMEKPYEERKKLLRSFIQTFCNEEMPNVRQDPFVQYVPYENNYFDLWKKVTDAGGEGIVAKHRKSAWVEGRRSDRWLKVKNWKKVNAFITAFDKKNEYFHIGVYDESGLIRTIGLFKNGLTGQEREILRKAVKENAQKEDDRFLYIAPGICVELFYLDWYEHKLREPYFSKFLFETSPRTCTFQQLIDNHPPYSVTITHPEKRLWSGQRKTKKDYLDYLTNIYPYMAPFLKNRPLTVIRYPHGIFGEGFFQKNCPDYAPDFVETYEEDGIRFILCNHFNTFIWLGNQLAIEFHIPFRTIERKNPSEIVIDLDPPTKAEFPLAKEAAMIIKEDIMDKLGLTAFIKVSGKRGLQLYIPLSTECSFTWEETRMFTKFIADYLVAKDENRFTTERLKINRGNRLYIDYVQHGPGKTIIAPFSVRGNEQATVATPIFWKELYGPLEPDGFSMSQVLNRLSNKGNPFETYFQVKNEEPFKEIVSFFKRNRPLF